MYNNFLNKILKRAKKCYTKRNLKRAEGSPAKAWRVVKEVIKKNNGRFPNSISPAKICGHFTHIAEKVTENNCSVRMENKFERCLPAEADVSLYLEPVTLTELKDVLVSFCNSAAGIHLVPLKAVKFVFNYIQLGSIFLINQCFQKGVC
jgi:hypothetical protein